MRRQVHSTLISKLSTITRAKSRQSFTTRRLVDWCVIHYVTVMTQNVFFQSSNNIHALSYQYLPNNNASETEQDFFMKPSLREAVAINKSDTHKRTRSSSTHRTPKNLNNGRRTAIGREKTHSKAPRDACAYCGKLFIRGTGMTYHVNTRHLNKYDFACDYCGKKYPIMGALRAHLRLAHKTKRETFNE